MSDTELVNGLRHMADDHPCCEATILRAIDKLQQLERENTTLRDTMTRLHSECDIEARKAVTAERNNAALRNEIVRLNNQTMWVCSCGGTDCAGQKENASLRADKERLDWIIGKAHYLFFKELGSDLAKGRQQIDAARKEAQP